MTGNSSVVLQVSQDLRERMEARAAADKTDMQEFLLRAVIVELMRPEAELVADRQFRALIATLPFPPSLQPMNERKPHAPHP